MDALRVPRFEHEVMRLRVVVIAAAVIAIAAGITTFVIGWRQPTEIRVATHRGVEPPASR